MHQAPVKIPDELLRSTWARERPYRPHWPATFDECAADPLISRVLDLLARKVPTYSRRSVDRLGVLPMRPRELEADDVLEAERLARNVVHVPRSPPMLDRKRLASGEREDD